MSGETLAGWVVFAFATALYIATSLVAGVAAGRAPGNRLLRGPIENGNGASNHQPPFDPAVLVASRALAYTALLIAIAALFVAIGAYLSDESQRGLVISVGVIAGLATLHITAGALRLTERGRIQRVVKPVEIIVQTISRIPGLRSILMRVSGTARQIADLDDIVTAAFEQNLDILEAAGVATDVEELRMIRGVLDLDTTRVREIMRPRVDMVVLDANATRRQAADLMIAEGYSKIPVIRDRIDDIVGIVYAHDLLRAQLTESDAGEGILDLVRPAIFVPESQYLEHLLQEFQRHRVQMAIVVDEYGGVSGVVTHQDLVEEIVGELEDEFDRDEPELQKVNADESLVDARLTLDSLNETFDTAIEGDGFDTVGGLVYRELGRMPVVGDCVSVAALKMTVESTTGRRIRNVRVIRDPAPTLDA
ncbi:MAG: hemolysin family protein [Chloroflexi bacterium]|nr:hemolysin family protein [Chloroflexota bacterium]